MKAARLSYLSEQDYLEGEKRSEVRHEYLDGVAYAMTGASRRHNDIVGNAYVALREAARRRQCHVYFEAVKVQVPARKSYYYPDLAVTCARETDDYVVTQPCTIIEVLSPSTAATDRREKRLAYLTLSMLNEYVLLDPDGPAATVYRRDGDAWIEETLNADDAIHIACLGLDLPLSSLYEDL